MENLIKIKEFILNNINNKYLEYIFMFILFIFILSFFNESNDEKIARIIQKYNEERNEIINYNTGIIKANKEKIIELEDINEDLSKCIEKLTSESGSVIKPECSPKSNIINSAKADFENTEYNSSFMWRKNSKGESKSYNDLCGDLSKDECNFENILIGNNLPVEPFIEYEKKYRVYKELALCIAWADSGLGKHLKSKNNIGNVGNNDRGNVVEFKTIDEGIEAIYKVLNNKFLGNKQSIGSLSPGGGGNSPFYATSLENWNINVLNCLNTIVSPTINENSYFRF